MTLWFGQREVRTRSDLKMWDLSSAALGTLRGDFCMSHRENIVHASDTRENAAIELDRFFDEGDYFGYESPLFDCLYAKDEL